MNALKTWFHRFFPTRNVAFDKRRLERLMRDEGLTRNAAMRVTRAYFGPPKK